MIAVSTNGRRRAAGRRGPTPAATAVLALAAACLAALALLALSALVARGPERIAPRGRLGAAARLPLGLVATASGAIGAAERAYWPTRHGSEITARGGGIESSFNQSGAAVSVRGGTVHLALAAVGRAAHLATVTTVAPRSSQDEVLFRRGRVDELYRNGPAGLEQAFTLRARPGGSGALVLALSLGGSLVARQQGSQVVFGSPAGQRVLRYEQLSATDAGGRRLPASIVLARGAIELRIDDRGARYPVRVDPFVEQGGKLTGGGETGGGFLGLSTAVSGDGSTALVGARFDNGAIGAAWVFTRNSKAEWSQQQKLVAAEEEGQAGFGSAVALSAEGNTALIGGPGDDSSKGAAWVFERKETGWAQQGAKIIGTGEHRNGEFGASVALSGDGKTALIGGPNEEGGAGPRTGAAWALKHEGTTWSEQKLTGSGESLTAEFGFSVALSADGTTALIGGLCDGSEGEGKEPLNCEPTGAGAAWVFKHGTTWTQQGLKLTPKDETGGGSLFGVSVALSSNGNTALIGGDYDNSGVGAAWAFTRSGETWTPQAKLAGTGEVGNGFFGRSVALSGDGNTALIGAPDDTSSKGAAWVFTRASEKWTPQLEKLTGTGETGKGLAGGSVALSGDGNTAVVGGPGDAGSAGAVWMFVNGIPTITSVTPPGGPKTGGTTVTLKGTNFGAVKPEKGGVKFGATEALKYTVESETQITAVSPPGEGVADIVLETPEHKSLETENDKFTYDKPVITHVTPSKGPLAGGTAVVITGANFAAFESVTFGGTAGSGGAVNAEGTEITVKSPAHVAGTVDIRVKTPLSESAKDASDEFTYVAPPTVTGLRPSNGPEAGESTVTIEGTNLVNPEAVHFGAKDATSVEVNAEGTQLTAKSPAGKGMVDVTVTTAGGTSVTSKADQFTYVPPPTVEEVKPNKGPEAAGTSVTIVGTHLREVETVKFGAAAASEVVVNEAGTQITATSPAHAPGQVDVIVSTPGGASKAGAADRFTFVARPAVERVAPNQGPESGGTSVTITGSHLSEVETVKFGAAAASEVVVNEAGTQITATSPAHAPGQVDVFVSTPGGKSAEGPSDKFTYVAAPTVTAIKPPNKGPEAGGTSVTITGAHFTGATAVKFGGGVATSFKVEGDTSISATSPAGSGTVDVTVTTAGGTSKAEAADRFSYLPIPSVEGVAPNQGPEGGGTSVTITGVHLSYATAVQFGAAAASEVIVNEAGTHITATSPANAPGTVDVTVTTPGGTSATDKADEFTYVPAPAVSAVAPSEGPEAGGTLVTVTGTHLTGAKAVKFGAAEGTGLKVESEATLTVKAPSGVETVDVTVTTVGGTSSTSEADRFSYVAPPAVETTSASFAQTTATLNAKVNPGGGKLSECQFEYGQTKGAPNKSKPCSSLPGAGRSLVPVSASVSGLSPSTTYYFRISVKNVAGAAKGEELEFKTLAPEPPTVVTGEASTVTQTAATLNGTANPNGTNTECKFEYGTSAEYGASVPCLPQPGSESIQFAESGAIAGLVANTTYHFRIVGKYAAGQRAGIDRTFKTLPNPPTVTTGEASAVTQTAATLSATVNPNDGEVGECKFEYGPSTAYGASAPCSSQPGAGASSIAVSAAVAGLSANTTYHFRITASNAGGMSTGADATFATPALAGHGPGQGGSPGGGPLPAVTLLSRSLAASRSGVLSVKILCPASESSCIGKITLRTLSAAASSKRAKKPLTLTHGPFTLTGGQTKTLKLRLTAAARALLSGTGKLRARATVLAHDPAGASATTLTNVTIRMKH